MSDHAHHHVNYLMVFVALCVCTAISVGLDILHMPPVLLVSTVLAVAVAKASFVMTYFMHLKFEGKWKFVILMPTAILAVGLMFALVPDMAMRYYSSEAPQVKMAETGQSAGGDHGAEPKHAKGHH